DSLSNIFWTTIFYQDYLYKAKSNGIKSVAFCHVWVVLSQVLSYFEDKYGTITRTIEATST
ncbi:hypothetical protein, partial [Streptococcus suis]